MGHTNDTNNLHLPQFVATDKPTFLGDINGAMLAIDNAYGTISAEATGAASTAQTAATAAAGAVETASGAVATAQQAATDATAAAGVAQTAADTANNAQSTAVLAKNTADGAAANVGNLADLDTTDKSSIVAAINEVVGELPESGGSVSVTADNVKTYATLLGELYALADLTKVRKESIITRGSAVYHTRTIENSVCVFTNTSVGSSSVQLSAITLGPTIEFNSANYTSNAWSLSSELNTVPVNGLELALYY